MYKLLLHPKNKLHLLTAIQNDKPLFLKSQDLILHND